MTSNINDIKCKFELKNENKGNNYNLSYCLPFRIQNLTNIFNFVYIYIISSQIKGFYKKYIIKVIIQLWKANVIN